LKGLLDMGTCFFKGWLLYKNPQCERLKDKVKEGIAHCSILFEDKIGLKQQQDKAGAKIYVMM